MIKRDIHNEEWLEEWKPEWKHEFHMEMQCILGCLMAFDHSAWIRHVGSTALPGMPAKPIIDILVCPDKVNSLEDCVHDLETIDYINLGECGRPGRYFLSSGSEPGQTFYLHLCYEDHPVAQDQILFLQLLRESRELFDKYVSIKRDLAFKFSDDRNMYREMKSLFIDGVLMEYRNKVNDQN